MGYEFGKAYCALCLRRPREHGGTGSCPIPQPLRAERHRSPHVGHSCPSFRLGDRRLKNARPLNLEFG